MITLRDINGDIFDDSSDKIEVSVTTVTREAIEVRPVKNVAGGNYVVLFTPNKCGDHEVSVLVDRQHIPGSPHKYETLCALLGYFTSVLWVSVSIEDMRYYVMLIKCSAEAFSTMNGINYPIQKDGKPMRLCLYNPTLQHYFPS